MRHNTTRKPTDASTKNLLKDFLVWDGCEARRAASTSGVAMALLSCGSPGARSFPGVPDSRVPWSTHFASSARNRQSKTRLPTCNFPWTLGHSLDLEPPASQARNDGYQFGRLHWLGDMSIKSRREGLQAVLGARMRSQCYCRRTPPLIVFE